MSNSLQFGLEISGRSLLAPTLFSELPEAVRERLLADAPLRSFADGQIIQQRGDEADGFWVIEAGIVRAGQFLPDGEFRAIAQLVAGDSYGELAVLAANRRAVDSVARGEARLRWIAADRFEAALRDDAANARALAGALALQLQELLGWIAGLRSGGSTARLAGLLLNLSGRRDHGGTVTATQEQLGELLGLTRATINKGLRELETAGAIQRGYGSLQIEDPEHLRAIALG